MDSKTAILVLSTILPGYLSAESGHGQELGAEKSETATKAAPSHEVKRLERNIKTTKIKNWVINKRNEELNSRMKELESRIAKMKESLQQEELAEDKNQSAPANH